MTRPTEITETILKARLKQVMRNGVGGVLDDEDIDRAFQEGKFSDFVGIVGRAELFARRKAAQTAKRHNHHVTSQQILRGE